MPAYLCHGFRWHRLSVRHFVVLQDVDDAAPEWIVAPKSAEAILETLYNLYDFIPPCAQSRAADSLKPNPAPLAGSNADLYKVNFESSSDEERRGRRGDVLLRDQRSLSASRQRGMSTSRLRKPGKRPETLPVPPRPMQAPPPLFSPMPPESERNGPFNMWSSIKMLEEYDPSNESVMNGPFAYLSDYAVRVDTSVSPLDEMRRYEERAKTEKFKAMSGSSDESGRRVNTAGNKRAGWLEKLRDQLQKDEQIKWYVVICGDEERSFPRDYKEDNVQGVKNGPTLEDDFVYRLPEFANYGYDRKSAVIQPLRLRKYDQTPPPPTPKLPQLQSRPPVRSLSQSRTPQTRTRPQTQPQPQQPMLRKPSVDRPPALPTKEFGEYAPPPDPLANLRDMGSRKVMEVDMKPGVRKSTMNLRRLFSKKQFENFI